MIKDGTGKGYFTKVDSNNRLWVYATTRSEIAFQSEYNQSAFLAYGRRNFTAANTNQGILQLVYNGSGTMHIGKVIISTNSDLCKVELYVGTTYTSGGTAIIPNNMNRVSNKSSDVIAYNGRDSNLEFDYIEANELFDVRLSKDSFDYDFEGGLILGNGNSIGMLGEVTSVGDKIRASVYYYEEIDA